MKVTIVNESTGFRTETETNSKGEYIFKEIPLGGPYTVIVNDDKKEGYSVNFGDQVTVNMDLGGEKNIEEVKITGNLKNKIGNLGAATAISAKNISMLPVNGRNFANLTELSPLSGKGGNLSGQLGSSTNFTIDGMTAKILLQQGLRPAEVVPRSQFLLKPFVNLKLQPTSTMSLWEEAEEEQ